MGDLSREHYLHEDAAQHYQQALDTVAITEEDRVRIVEKLERELYVGRNPTSAIPLVESLLDDQSFSLASIASSSFTRTEATIEALRQRARLFQLDGRTHEAGDSMLQAVDIADASGVLSLRKRARLAASAWLLIMGRTDKVKILLEAIKISKSDDSSFQTNFYALQGGLAALSGDVEGTYAHYDKAIEAAKDDIGASIISIWYNYSYWAWVLGDIDRDKACCERALLLARRFGVIWQIAFACLSYADTLALLGRNELAHKYLLEALSYNVRAPRLSESCAEIGIPIALSVNNEATLARCVDLQALEVVFQSGEPSTMVGVVDAVVHWYYAKGSTGKARALLHRAIQALSALQENQRVPGLWRLCISVARYGASSDIPIARKLIESLSVMPVCHDLGRACHELFDAFVMHRRRKTPDAIQYARAAFHRFSAAGWQKYADLAAMLLSPADTTPVVIERKSSHAPVDLLAELTPREREIAQLLLDGLTNREIAAELSISRYTVESHVASIMNRLGIRSRHQLASALPQDIERYP